MTESNVVQIRKKGGLEKIVKSKQGTTINPVLFRSKTKNRNEEGVIEGDYRGRTILDTKHFIAPMWSDLKNQWSFEGNVQDLERLIKKMKLRYPRGHSYENSVIEPGDRPQERLTNRKDEVFNHPDLYGKYFMENGRVSLDLSNPVQEFLYRCYRGNELTDLRDGDGKISKYVQAGTRYEIVSPKKENQRAKRDADKEVKAITLLAAMDNSEEKMRAIANIMDLPQYSESTDLSGLFILLKDVAAQNPAHSPKYNKSYQDRFIELAKMSDDELNIHNQVVSAKKAGILRRRQGFYLFNGERLDGLDSDMKLFNYFKSDANQEDYLKLVDLLDA